MDLLAIIIEDGFWSAIAALGFAMLFNVPQRALPACAVTGAFGHATRTVLMEMNWQIVPATLVGAVVVGFVAAYFARQYKMPATLFSISGSIPLVPGVFAFQAMLEILRVTNETEEEAIGNALILASQNGIITGLVLASIAVGIAMPSLLFDRDRPVV